MKSLVVGWVDGWVDEWMGGWMDGWVGVRVGGWWMGGRASLRITYSNQKLCFASRPAS